MGIVECNQFVQENETAIEFAQRVKADICRKGGLVDLPWYVLFYFYKENGCTNFHFTGMG